MEHEAEYAKLVARYSDYDELLRSGFIVVHADYPESWRQRLKADARADRVRVRTGVANNDDHLVWAYLKHLDELRSEDRELEERYRHVDEIREAMSRARLRGHVVESVLRSEGSRVAAICERCRSRLYLDTSSDPPFMEGEVFDTDCPASTAVV